MGNLLAIDGSTKSTGIAVYRDKELIHYECITASSNNLFTRIHKMVKRIEELLIDYKIDNVVMEEVLPSDVKNNRKVYKALMYLQAGVADLMDSHKVDIDFKLPSEWRAACKIKNGRGIKRDTEKEYDIAFVKENFNIEANDDVCDAICIGYSVIHANDGVNPAFLEGGFELK